MLKQQNINTHLKCHYYTKYSSSYFLPTTPISLEPVPSQDKIMTRNGGQVNMSAWE